MNTNLYEIKNPEEIYPGCYGRVSLKFYPYYKENICGVGCSINNVQKICDGQVRTSLRAEDDFTIIEDEDILS